jgi:hypothetical protein
VELDVLKCSLQISSFLKLNFAVAGVFQAHKIQNTKCIKSVDPKILKCPEHKVKAIKISGLQLFLTEAGAAHLMSTFLWCFLKPTLSLNWPCSFTYCTGPVSLDPQVKMIRK